MFKVLRHGGRSTDEWRTLLETDDYGKAEERFNKVALKLRQGRVVITDGERVIKSEWAPLLRTRW